MSHSLFQRFVIASGLTNLADGIATLAWAWLASLITRDPLLISVVPVALRLPWFFCAIPAGIVTDRVDRRKLILSMDLIRAGVFAFIAFAVWNALPLAVAPVTGLADPFLFAALLVAALIVGIAEVFRDNAAQTMLPAIVPEEQLEKANGRLWSVELVGNALLGPAVGAFLITWALPAPFVMNMLAYLLAFTLIFRMGGEFRPIRRARMGRQDNWRVELKEGFAFLAGAPLLRALAWITGFWNLLFQMAMIGLVLHVQENLDLGARSYGMIFVGGAVGGVLGGWYGEEIIRRLGPKRTAQWMLCASAPSFLAIAYAPSALALGIVLAFFQFTGLVWNTVSVSYRQRHIPDALLGRVNSLYRLMAWGMMPVGLMLSGLCVRLADGITSRDTALITPFLVASAGALFLAVIGWRALDCNWGRD